MEQISLALINGRHTQISDTDTIRGTLPLSVYDPQGVGSDAFARASHTGTQLLNTISDAGTSAGLNAGTGAGELAPLDGQGRLQILDGSNLFNVPPDPLQGLSDTVITDVGNKDIIAWDSSSSKYINQTIAELGIQPSADKGQASGYCPLGADVKVPTQYLPDSILGAVKYQGVWNATTNIPALSDGSGDQGFYFKVSIAGTTSVDGESDWQIGDWIVSNGTAWEKVDNTDLVSSVAGRTGAIALVQADIAGLTILDTPTFASLHLTDALTTGGTVNNRDMVADGAKLDLIDDEANNYIHPTDPGSIHIPTGGNPGQRLANDGSGKAKWRSDSNVKRLYFSYLM